MRQIGPSWHFCSESLYHFLDKLLRLPLLILRVHTDRLVARSGRKPCAVKVKGNIMDYIVMARVYKLSLIHL